MNGEDERTTPWSEKLLKRRDGGCREAEDANNVVVVGVEAAHKLLESLVTTPEVEADNRRFILSRILVKKKKKKKKTPHTPSLPSLLPFFLY